MLKADNKIDQLENELENIKCNVIGRSKMRRIDGQQTKNKKEPNLKPN